MKKKAVVLLSGGLDSSTTLFWAKKQGYDCFALVFDYGQRHKKEVRHAVKIAKLIKVPYRILKIALHWEGSSLLNKKMKVPVSRSLKEISTGIPSTYVPGRNIIFLSFAISYAEAIGAGVVLIGANAVDFSGYPDCRPAFYRAFQKVVEEGTKKKRIKILTPLIHKTKAQIVRLAKQLNVPIDLTWSCYQGGKYPCGVCDSCKLRAKGIRESS
ncbi:MAG: 7-cyano-7-deazaguanine synthase QueC [Candidatus Saganbacteria bacterium]|nr:7-cyano-7-deazaguanine synthase QueC [Candidatus Saganbacteria bacterium]